MSKKFKEIDIDQIDQMPQDLRFSRDKGFAQILKNDLEIEGLISVPIVRIKRDGRFEIVDGVTRIKKLKELGEKTVLCRVVEKCSETDAIVLGLKMNLKRKSHEPMGVARAFQTLHKKHKWKQKQIAERFGFSESWVSKLLALNKLNPEYQRLISIGEITVEEGYRITRSGMGELMEILDIRRETKGKAECELCGILYPSIEVQNVSLCGSCGGILHHAQKEHDRTLQREKDQAERLGHQKFLT